MDYTDFAAINVELTEFIPSYSDRDIMSTSLQAKTYDECGSTHVWMS